eukprot:GHUV01006810.1.p1 GENE.GHUV01006810.1~~GHUV01006810.1.p1  ORF type:complete len:145 (+),score=29.18 GHUV01006810.1:273-707(+)
MQSLCHIRPFLVPCSSAVRGMSSLHALLGAAPPTLENSSNCSIPPHRSPVDDQIQQHDHQQQLEQLGMQLPSLCGEPKNKLSLHRRGNRRISYYSRRTELLAHCKYCGASGLPHQWFPASSNRCTGQCNKPPAVEYPRGYMPPL